MDICGYIFIYCFWQLTHVVLKVEKLHTKYLLTKRTSLLLLSCSFPVLFVSVCVVQFLVVVFLFTTCSIPTCCWVSILFFYVNTYLQQSTCIMFISLVVGFALSCCLLLFSCSLGDHFPHCCLGFQFFCLFKKNCNNPLEVI
jgi:hypothetical protein